jgi:hypothetical protein
MEKSESTVGGAEMTNGPCDGQRTGNQDLRRTEARTGEQGEEDVERQKSHKADKNLIWQTKADEIL